ncbi:MAG: hypothetical protein NTY38_01965, partial [Acidobacteria bacterium]|nr:hypothetical protein [Acidobacteriota bacterium]
MKDHEIVDDVENATVKLYAEDAKGNPLPNSPLVTRAKAPARAAIDPVAEHRAPNAPAQFTLPPAWVADEGEIVFRAEVQPPSSVRDPNSTNNLSRKQTFQRIRVLPKGRKFRVGYMAICLEPAPGAPLCPSNDIGSFYKLMGRIYPVPDTGISYFKAAVPESNWTEPLTG